MPFDQLLAFIANNPSWLAAAFGFTFIMAFFLFWVVARTRKSAQWRVQALQSEWKLQEMDYQREQQLLQATLEQEREARIRAEQALTQLRVENHRLEIQLAEQRVREREQSRALESEASLLKSARQALTQEFELLANRLFEAKQQQFSQNTKDNLEQVIGPFRQQIKDFHQRVEEAQRSDIAHRSQLMGQISELQKQSQQIGTDAVKLANALKGNNKLQGNWGEVVLARVLEQSGLVRGREFDVQVSDKNADGKRFQPDVIVRLPDEKDVVIDAKVSLVAYERYLSGSSAEERSAALKSHMESLKNHIKNLASKKYDELATVRSLDFVFLFVPIEGAFSIVLRERPELLQDAYDNNIVLVSPTSLMVALRTIESLWRRERQNKNVEKIVICAGRLYDQFVRFVEALEEVGVGLKKADDSYQTALKRLSTGRGNLVRRTEELKELGAKTSRTVVAPFAQEALQTNEVALLVEDDEVN